MHDHFRRHDDSMSQRDNKSTNDTDTRSQAVARIADRTASQHLWGSRELIGHMTI